MEKFNEDTKFKTLLVSYYENMLLQEEIEQREYRAQFNPLRIEFEKLKSAPVKQLLSDNFLTHFPTLHATLGFTKFNNVDGSKVAEFLNVPEQFKESFEAFRSGKASKLDASEISKGVFKNYEEGRAARFQAFQDKLADDLDEIDNTFSNSHKADTAAYEFLLDSQFKPELEQAIRDQVAGKPEAEYFKVLDRQTRKLKQFAQENPEIVHGEVPHH